MIQLFNLIHFVIVEMLFVYVKTIKHWIQFEKIKQYTVKTISITMFWSKWKIGERYTCDLFEGSPEKQPRPTRLTTQSAKISSICKIIKEIAREKSRGAQKCIHLQQEDASGALFFCLCLRYLCNSNFRRVWC